MASRTVVISADDRGPWIIIVTWILGVVMCLSSFTKVLSKRVRSQETQRDDVYVIIATLLAIGYDATISVQVKAGLGRYSSSLGPKKIIHYQQAAYASQILYVAALCLAKMASLQFMVLLARIKTRRTIVRSFMMFNLIFTVTAIFTIAFQCPEPRPWAIFSNACFDQSAFWDAFGVMDALIDIATALIPVYLLHDLQLAWSRKIPVMVFFASRASLVPIIIVRLVYLNAASESVDHPYDDFTTVLTTSVHANLSVIVTCVPFIKPIIDSLQTGILASDIHTSTSSRHPSYALRWLGSGSETRAGSVFNKWPKNNRQGNVATATSGGFEENWERGLRTDSEERMIIKQTKTVAVQSES